ncbi:hypothetical protein HYPSUDRAFT_56914 [Hypholoma sublateritium FD-334 SS-4]|uniref:Uncharacterized protein n=1 Tax=Hypholoma sublateritium (strain FD-334 SS-4) TaxID=945553 RepID=A0A0D2KVX5_HYPSF|nr:hypothetical protein HYPSUDRAFT_56914 [Hypholoma sublateritium FD-334 SS-4]
MRATRKQRHDTTTRSVVREVPHHTNDDAGHDRRARCDWQHALPLAYTALRWSHRSTLRMRYRTASDRAYGGPPCEDGERQLETETGCYVAITYPGNSVDSAATRPRSGAASATLDNDNEMKRRRASGARRPLIHASHAAPAACLGSAPSFHGARCDAQENVRVQRNTQAATSSGHAHVGSAPTTPARRARYPHHNPLYRSPGTARVRADICGTGDAKRRHSAYAVRALREPTSVKSMIRYRQVRVIRAAGKPG